MKIPFLAVLLTLEIIAVGTLFAVYLTIDHEITPTVLRVGGLIYILGFHGNRLKYRSVVFFGIILILAVSSFKVIEIVTTQ